MTADEQCSYCGRSVAPDALYCGGCGRQIVRTVTPRTASGRTSAGGPPTMAIGVTGPAPPGAVEPDADADGYYERRRWVLPLAIAAVVVVAAVVVAVVVATRSNDTKHPTQPADNTPIAMPYVVMSSRAEAIATLERAGFGPKRIVVHTTPRTDVGPDTVLEQKPVAGSTAVGPVTLTVATAPATMPNFVGQSINESRATLSTLNVNLTVANTLNGTVADGTVIAQLPSAGSPFAKTVVLSVARTPIPTRLDDLTGVGKQPAQRDSETIGPTQYQDSLTWDTPVCLGAQPVTITYDLGGLYQELTATAGLGSETVDPSEKVQLEIQVDGASVFTRVLDLQTPVPVDLDVTGHHQLQLTFTAVDPTAPACTKVVSALGRPQLLSTAQGH